MVQVHERISNRKADAVRPADDGAGPVSGGDGYSGEISGADYYGCGSGASASAMPIITGSLGRVQVRDNSISICMECR